MKRSIALSFLHAKYEATASSFTQRLEMQKLASLAVFKDKTSSEHILPLNRARLPNSLISSLYAT